MKHVLPTLSNPAGSLSSRGTWGEYARADSKSGSAGTSTVVSELRIACARAAASRAAASEVSSHAASASSHVASASSHVSSQVSFSSPVSSIFSSEVTDPPDGREATGGTESDRPRVGGADTVCVGGADTVCVAVGVDVWVAARVDVWVAPCVAACVALCVAVSAPSSAVRLLLLNDQLCRRRSPCSPRVGRAPPVMSPAASFNPPSDPPPFRPSPSIPSP